MQSQSSAVKPFPESVVGSAADLGRPLRVMHVLSVSIPHINGYALRSKYIVETQAESGFVDPVVVTSPFYPGLKGTAEDSVIDGISYHRVASPQDKGRFRNPRLFLFVLLHWAKRFVDWSIPSLRRKRKRAMGYVKSVKSFARRWRNRLARYVVRVGRYSRRVLQTTGQLIEVITEPIVGKRFLRTMEIISYWSMAVVWVCLRPFFLTLRAVWRWVHPFLLSISRSVQKWFNGPQTRSAPRRSPLRQRLMVLLQAWEKSLLLKLFERKIVGLCQTIQPDVIHVHSPYFCGVPAVKAGKSQGIPVVYEVRGIWEESGVAQGNFKRDGEQYLMWRRNETWAMTNADAVTCICDQLRQEIVGRGVDPGRVFVAANAVDATLFVPKSHSGDDPVDIPDSAREVQHRLGKHTIGYIGSVRPLEGVDGLVRGAAEVIHRGYDAMLLVVGGGAGINKLMELAEELGIAEQVIFTGQVPHDEVHFYYELIDTFVISRPASRVAKLVTPLKPLEAMAMEKALVVSDLPALRELVTDGETGLVYRAEDAADLADKCIKLIEDDELRCRLATTARQWVSAERSWKHTIVPQLEAYAAVVPEFAAPTATPAVERRAA